MVSTEGLQIQLNGNDLINAFKLSFAIAHRLPSKILLQLKEETVCRGYKNWKNNSSYKSTVNTQNGVDIKRQLCIG